MISLSRRQSLGLLAGAVVPPTAVVGAAEPETQEQKCVRLIQELLAECRQLQPNFEGRGGPVFRFEGLDPVLEKSSFGFGNANNPAELLMVFVDRKGE